MKVLLVLSLVIATSWAYPSGVHLAAAIPAQPVAVVPHHAPSSQYHAQDELGQYSYGYSNADGQAKAEIKGIDGSIAGKYSYIDANGKRIEVTYVADKDGFRATGDHLPKEPALPPHLAKAYEEANTRLAAAYSKEDEEERGGGGGGGYGQGEDDHKGKGSGKDEKGEEEEEEEDDDDEEEEEDEEEEKEKGDGKEKDSSKPKAPSAPAAPVYTQPQPQQHAILGFAHLGHYALAQPVAYVPHLPATGYIQPSKPVAPAPPPPPPPVIKPVPPVTTVAVTKMVKSVYAPPQTVHSYVRVPQYHTQPQASAVYNWARIDAPQPQPQTVAVAPIPSVAHATHVVPQVAVYPGSHLIGKASSIKY